MIQPVRKIVAIGGGEIRKRETSAIDTEIIRLTQKEDPKLLFIPTASSDSEDYWRSIDGYYGATLGCRTDVLRLVKQSPSYEQIAEKVLSADIIYVGGGNTLKMMKLWRRLGVDTLLETAWKRGAVLCGISAGSICWFDSGHSDSLSFYNPNDWKYIKVRGLGFLKGIHCPHYDSETSGKPRREHFHAMIDKFGGMGIALDNNCAIEFCDNAYRVIASQEQANAYRVFRQKNTVFVETITKAETYAPITDLFRP